MSLSNKYLRSIIAGLTASILMTAFYWLVLYLTTQDLAHPLYQFQVYKYWMTAIILGFGLQVALFWYIRSGNHLADKSAVATGAGTSTVAMVACCAHHLADFLPIIGLAGAAIFLTEYQVYFFLLGVLSNILGISYMIYIIRTKHHIPLRGFMKKILFIKKYT